MEIFELINKNDNLMFSSLKSKDLIEIIDAINTYSLDYRDKLNLNSNITFGCELEFEYSRNDLIKEELRNIKLYKKNKDDNYGYVLVKDGSLTHGGEINSPVLTDTKLTWINFKKVCEIARKHSKISDCSSSHIHVGYNIINNRRELIDFMILYSCYENIIYRFYYGEYLYNRRGVKNYAYPCSILFRTLIKENCFDENKSIEVIMKKLKENDYISRYAGLNLINASDCNNIHKNTIEFRMPNGTLEEIVWQNNVNLAAKLLCTKNYDKDIIKRRFKINNDSELFKYGDLDCYSEINLDMVLEFIDIVFDNNLDKVYFLKQYFKDFDNAYKPMVKAKRFII